MSLKKRLVLPGIALGTLVVSGLLGWSVGGGRLDGSRDGLDDDIAKYVRVMNGVRDERTRRPELDARLSALLDRTLGADLEYVDSRVRGLLAELLESAGLENGTVSTTGGTLVETPAKREFSRAPSARSYRDEPDFVLVGASASGRGSIAEVVEFLHGLDAAGWVKRIDSVRLDPDPSGRRISCSVRITTLFVPGAEPVGDRPATRPGIRPLGRYAEMVAANPFALEEKPEPPKVARPPQPVAPVTLPDPLSGWILTGLVEGDPGKEAWCRHLPSGRTATLLPGVATTLDREVEVTLVDIDADIATIRLGEESWTVLVGSPLQRPAP